ncbi:hypothetical protein, partial [Mycobacterium interjectum]|uniref:hypothetical protein n=1 Tax=Mycobacterium interjectum TaxID=33895 RepID=UPI0021F33CD6
SSHRSGRRLRRGRARRDAAREADARQLQRASGGPTKSSVESAEITCIPAPYGARRRGGGIWT